MLQKWIKILNLFQAKEGGPTDLISYLETLNVNMKSIAVAHNGEVVPRDELGGVTLEDGDRLEIVRAVGGGG